MKKTGDEFFDSKEFQLLYLRYEEAESNGHPLFFDVEELIDIADYFNFIGEKAKAMLLIDEACQRFPHATLPNIFLFREAIARNDLNEAKQILSRVVDRTDPEYLLAVGELYLAQDKTDDAERVFNRFYDMLPDDEKDHGAIDIAEIYFTYAKPKMVFKWLNGLQDKETKEVGAMVAKVNFLMGNYQDCKKAAMTLLDKNPYDALMWTLLANTQNMLDDNEEALSSAEFAIAINPDLADAICAKANALFKLDNMKEAKLWYERYLELVPNDACSLLYYGMILNNLEQYPQAIEHLNDALDETLSTDLDNKQLLRSIRQELTYAESRQLIREGRKEEARCRFEEHLSYCDDELDPRFRWAFLLMANGDEEEAYRIIDEIKGRYSAAAINPYLALLYWEIKDEQLFLDYLQRSIESDPKQTQELLGPLFPDNLMPEDYYSYIISQLNTDDE